MLKPAIKYREQLENLWYDIWFEEKYKYWNCGAFYEAFKIDEDTWNRHQFVSTSNDEVIGLIQYNIDRQSNSVSSLEIINFTDNIVVFGRDLKQALTDIFEKYKFRKINFSVVIGNPIEKSYNKMIEKHGGRIVGVYKDDVKLMDGNYYDRKLYEIFADDYFNYRRLF